VITSIQTFLKSVVQADAASIAAVIQELELLEPTANKFTLADLEDVKVPLPITLRVFRDRSLQYTQSGQVGVLMSVLPFVGLKSAEMSVALDVSDVTGFTSATSGNLNAAGGVQATAGLPVIEHRYFSSDLEVRDGQPLVLSGIKRSSEVHAASGIPWLRDIPWAGYLFGHETTTKSGKDIVVILTPHFKLCATSEAAPPEEVQTAINIVKGATPKVEQVPFGFDQWLLDSNKPIEPIQPISVPN
jgi:hypothetical protein